MRGATSALPGVSPLLGFQPGAASNAISKAAKFEGGWATSWPHMHCVTDVRIPVHFAVIITAFNEGEDLISTLESIRKSSVSCSEILIVDDGSTDNSIDSIELSSCLFIRHSERLGVAISRDDATSVVEAPSFCFFDAHQRVMPHCIDDCSRLAVDKSSIVCPDLCDFGEDAKPLHGAYFVLRKDAPPFGAEWYRRPASSKVTTINSLRAPPYVIPASIYPKVRWSRLLRGWGGSEACVSLKAFFTKTPILHLHGPIAYHKFKKSFHYDVGWDEIWRNHALIARICFSEATWSDYWLPEVFQEHLSVETQQEMDSDAVKAEHLEFQQIKVRPDHEFWTRLAFQKIPPAVKR